MRRPSSISDIWTVGFAGKQKFFDNGQAHLPCLHHRSSAWSSDILIFQLCDFLIGSRTTWVRICTIILPLSWPVYLWDQVQVPITVAMVGHTVDHETTTWTVQIIRQWNHVGDQFDPIHLQMWHGPQQKTPLLIKNKNYAHVHSPLLLYEKEDGTS